MNFTELARTRPVTTWAARAQNGRLLAAERRIPGTWLLAAGALLVSVLILAVPAYLGLRAAGSAQATLDTLQAPRTWQTLGNTILLAASVVVSTTLIALPSAWLTTMTDLPLRRLWAVLVALPLVVPSYVAAYLYLSLLSPRGALQQLLEPLTGLEQLPSIYGFWGAFLVLTLITYPFTFLAVRAGLQRLDPSLMEAARSLGLSPVAAFRRVTIPYLRPSLVAGSLLVALYCLRDFGAVNLLQYGTFTRVIYNRYRAFRLDEAAAMALLLVLLALVILLLDHHSRGRAGYARLSAGSARAHKPIRLGPWKWPAMLFLSVVVMTALVIPAGGLVYWFGRGLRQDYLVRDLGPALSNVGSLLALGRPALHSLAVSAAAAVLTVALALPVAVLAVRKPGRWSHLAERLTYTSAALPGIVVALAYVFIGANYLRPLYQTLPLMLIAYVVLFIPQAIGSERSSILQVPASLEEAGRSLGKRPGHVFRAVTLPLVRPGILAAAALVFLTAMKELPATLLLSPTGFDTLAVDVWANVSEAFFARAAAPTLLLILLSSVPLALMSLRDGAEQ